MIKTQETEWIGSEARLPGCWTSKPTFSAGLSPTSFHFPEVPQTFPNSVISWGPSVQAYKPVEDISYLNQKKKKFKKRQIQLQTILSEHEHPMRGFLKTVMGPTGVSHASSSSLKLGKCFRD